MKMYFTKLQMILFVFGFISSTAVMAQSSLTIDATQLQTNFHFTNSNGEVDPAYLPAYNGAYSIGYRYISLSSIMVRANVGMRNAGATMIYDDTNYMWDLQYVNGQLGVGYMFELGRFNPYINIGGYYGYLLKGIQVQNDVSYDLIKSQEMKRTDYGALAIPGLQVKLSEYISVYTEFSYLMGLQNIENQKVEGATEMQEGFNRAYSATLGVAFSITQ